MIKKEQLLKATHEGLDIILYYYPQARAVLAPADGGDPDDGGPRPKKFAIRNERTPSATLRRSAKSGNWVVTDFGESDRGMGAIDVALKEEHGLTFHEVLLKLGGIFGVKDELNRSVNKPDFKEWDLTHGERPEWLDEIGCDLRAEDLTEGAQHYRLNDALTAEELSVLGPLVREEHAAALKWHSVRWWCRVKEGKARFELSTATYPIFMRECVVEGTGADAPGTAAGRGDGSRGAAGGRFFKVYRPLNPDKGWRFSYFPAGAKPRRYINGLAELRAAYAKFNEAQAAEWDADPENEGKPYKFQKLERAVICSGERDSLCAKSLGEWPLWLNSETDEITEGEMKEVLKLVERVYNIPDIDATGVRKGTELALQHVDVHTVWLPKELSGWMDNRGHGRKDFRDWLELKQTQGVQGWHRLIESALPAKFWKSRQNKKTGEWTHEVDTACLHEFLRLNGFYILREDAESDRFLYVRIEGHTVTQVTVRAVREFVIQWVRDHSGSIQHYRGVLNLVLNTPKLQGTALESIQSTALDFTTFTPSSQYYFFRNAAVRVTGGGVELNPEESRQQRYIWKVKVQPHDFKGLGEMFRVTREKGADGSDRWDIEVTEEGLKSKFLCFLVNSSRIFWRKELEGLWKDERTVVIGDQALKPETDDGVPLTRREYGRLHHFDIGGPLLAPEEILVQKRNLVSKIFTAGFLLHRYKDLSKTWAPFCMDNKIGADDECNGRSGKSFFISTLGRLMTCVKLSGRNPSLLENSFVYDQVTRQTDLIRVDDCAKYFKTEQMYDLITDDMVVNPKNFSSFTIPYAESPKVAFTTNYIPADFSASTDARLLYVVFSDYYHNQSPGSDYGESRTIFDDFGKNLYGPDYSEEEWNADFNFMMQALRFYLSLAGENIKIQPDISDIMVRKYKAEMGANFEDWADGYFAPESGHLDILIVRQEAFENFQRTTNMKNLKMQWFSRALQAYANLHAGEVELNPAELLNGSGRLIRRNPQTGVATEYIYMKTAGKEADGADAPGTVADGGEAPGGDEGQGDLWDEMEKEVKGA